MRSIVSFAAAMSLLMSAASAAPTRCASPTDQDAFDVGTLKSELSVLAVGCSNEDGYNQFVERYRTRLVTEDHVVNAWFSRTYGRSAQSHYDSYITLLANEQSQAGLRQGSDFCPRLQLLFTEVMALPDASVLAQYAAAKDLTPPEMGTCESDVVASSSKGRRPAARHRS
jgi:hypothetical protein